MPFSLAIPTYNSSEFILDAIRLPVKNELISEIIINDDGSSNEEYQKLLNVINEQNSEKIKVYKNENNSGAFKNKYDAITKCTNKWVYLLDSDNYVHEGMLEKFFNQDLQDNVCYMPHKYDFDSSIVEIQLGFENLNAESIKQAIKNNTIGHFVNLCNFFVNKDLFLERMKEGFDIEVFPIADCATMTYLWLKNGGEFKVIKDYHYYHRVRGNGYYLSNRSEAEKCVAHYNNKILQL